MTRPRITLYQYAGLERGTTLSPPCGKVRMALAFKGLAFAVHDCRTPAEVRRYNPRGRVPVLEIDGERIVDSTDIVSELERRFPEPPLEPADPRARALAWLLEDWADESLYFCGLWLRWRDPEGFARVRARVLSRMPIPLRWIVPALVRRETARRASGQGIGLKDKATVLRELDAHLAALAGLLEDRPFLVGDAPSRADLAVAAVLDQLAIEALTPEAARLIGGHDALEAWRERVHRLAPNQTRPG